MRRLLREPLLHFLIFGVLLFALYGWASRGLSLTSDVVVVDQSRADLLAAQFERTWQRPPAPSEMQGLIDDWVQDKIIYREGLEEGVDRDDEIVRRRVVQKMSFLVEGMAADVPSEAELQTWLREHPEAYRVAPTYTLRQVYFDPKRHGDDVATVIQNALTALQHDPQVSVGDAPLLPESLSAADANEVARTFGKSFESALTELPDGRWVGPVTSSFGLHLVRIGARKPGRIPALSEVRKAVERDLLHARSRRATEVFYDALRKGYTVKIEADLERVGDSRATPQPADAPAVAGSQ